MDIAGLRVVLNEISLLLLGVLLFIVAIEQEKQNYCYGRVLAVVELYYKVVVQNNNIINKFNHYYYIIIVGISI